MKTELVSSSCKVVTSIQESVLNFGAATDFPEFP
jgi:hypothetical protein